MANTLAKSSLIAIAAAALAAPAFANTVSTNAVQLTITQAANSQSGVTQGGQFSLQGTGLDSTVGGAGASAISIPTIAFATGIVSVADNNAGGVNAAANTSFNYTATIRQADSQNTSTAIGTLGAGTFADLTTKSSAGSGTVGTIAISNAGAATLTAGTGAGSTATGIISTTAAGRFTSLENRRVASSSNAQNITNSDVQQSKFQLSGDGLTAVTGGGFNNVVGAASTAAGSTVRAGGDCGAGSNCAAGNAFNIEHEITPSQNAVAMNVTSTTVNTPAYGIVEHIIGGTTAGALTVTDINTVTAIAGGAGTSSSLSKVGELTAFN